MLVKHADAVNAFWPLITKSQGSRPSQRVSGSACSCVPWQRSSLQCCPAEQARSCPVAQPQYLGNCPWAVSLCGVWKSPPCRPQRIGLCGASLPGNLKCPVAGSQRNWPWGPCQLELWQEQECLWAAEQGLWNLQFSALYSSSSSLSQLLPSGCLP